MRIQKKSSPGWISVLLLVMFAGSAFAQSDTVWIPVTYFDFHSDTTNPEFEQPHRSGVVTGMVQDTLDSDNLPVKGSVSNLNEYIKYWYRAWDGPNGSKGNYNRPLYNSQGYFQSFTNVGNDLFFRNIVIEDSLPFVSVAGSPGMYQYDNQEFFPLDNIGFGNEYQSHNYSFTMSLHYKFTKTKTAQTFNFRGDDDVWAFIDKKLVMDLGGIHTAATGSFTVSNDLVLNKEYQFDFFFAERHTSASSIRIQTNLFEHSFPPPILIVKDTTPCAGDTVPIVASVTMDDSLRTDMARDVTWKILSGDNPVSTIRGNVSQSPIRGDTLYFMPTEAYDTVVIQATAYDSILSVPVITTTRLIVSACHPDHITIEECSSEHNLRDDEPVPNILIASTQTQAEVCAVVRDRFGNYIRLANNPTWTATDNSVTVIGAPGETYRGIITRNADNDSTIVIATEASLIPDSVKVILLNSCIDSLRLKDASGNIVTSITMTTGEKRSYTVEGRKSTDNSWVIVDATWQLTSPPDYTIATPSRNSIWTLDPTSPGTSTLNISRPFDTTCITRPTLAIPVTVTRETATRVELDIITPVNERIAGDTLLAVVRIYNSDGLIPGAYCFGDAATGEAQQVIYNDTLKNPANGKQDLPRLSVDGVWTNLNMGYSETIKNDQCFSNGIDTIKFISYYTPFPYTTTDSVHLLGVNIGNNRIDQEEFRLIPASIDSIDITDNNHVSITTEQVFQSGGTAKIYKTTSYDEYGNIVSIEQISDWTTGGSITLVTEEQATKFIFTPDTVLTTTTGTLRAMVIVGTDTIYDEITIRITDLPATFVSATTRDDNGNGYLDRIEVVFNKGVSISELNASLFSIGYDTYNFSIVRIVPLASDSSSYSIYITEIATSVAQTAWRPVISSEGQSDFNAFTDKVCSDGAGPVVWKVVKYQQPGLDRSNDILEITLSEPFKRADGQSFAITDIPELTFNVWLRDYTDTTKYTLVQMLAGITGYEDISNATMTLRIRTTNGLDITANNYINIKAQDSTLTDNMATGNYVDLDNVKKRVVVIAQPEPPTPIPNPTTYNFEHTDPGVFNFVHDPLARTFAKDQKGVAINIRTPFPVEGEKVKAVAKIYDLVGNIVITTYNNDLITEADIAKAATGGIYDFDIYWNGSNAKGMGVAPGVYKIVIYLSYSKKSQPNKTYQNVLGFRK